MEAGVFLARIMQKTKVWKHARTKLILIIAEGPIHAEDPPDSSGHCINLGKTSTIFLAVNRRRIETKTQNA